MKSEIIDVKLEDGNIQKYQVVSEFKWNDLIFEIPSFNKKVINAMAHLYHIQIIPKAPNNYGTLIFYNLNKSISSLDRNTDIGYIFDDNILFQYYLTKAVKDKKVSIINDEIIIDDIILSPIFEELIKDGLVDMAKGNLSTIVFFPVTSEMGYLSEIKDAKFLVNSHFFLMEQEDIDSPYGELGTPHGFTMYNSKIILPPLNHRKSLTVDENDKVKIQKLHVTDFEIEIDNKIYKHDENCTIYTRPNYRETPKCEGYAIVIVKDKVVAIKKKGQVIIPMAGFVIQDVDIDCIESDKVKYLYKEKYKFAIQVGPTMIEDSYQHLDFDTPFYRQTGVPFPSTSYPLDFEKGRASRIGIGVKNNNPVIIWAEGGGKLGHVKGKESCGASLLEFSNFCKDYGISNLINLDGGGSSQMIINGTKSLKISGRKKDTISEAERPIPYAIIIK